MSSSHRKKHTLPPRWARKQRASRGITSVERIGIISTVGAVIITLVPSALSIAGVVDMSGARVLLWIAWGIAIAGALIVEWLSGRSPKHILGSGVLAAVLVGLFLLDVNWWMVKKKAEQIAASAPTPPERSQRDDGFLQLERTELVVDKPTDKPTLAAGRPFRMNYHLFNRGGRPVYDAHSWGWLIVADASKNSDENMQAVFKKGIEDGYRKFSGRGQSVSINGEVWDTAVSEPFTIEQINSLVNGAGKLYFLVGAVWTGEDNKPQYLFRCSWVSNIRKDLNMFGIPLHNCGL